jgi:hypothetical protein
VRLPLPQLLQQADETRKLLRFFYSSYLLWYHGLLLRGGFLLWVLRVLPKANQGGAMVPSPEMGESPPVPPHVAF